MISRDAKPVEGQHRPVYRPINLSGRKPQDPNVYPVSPYVNAAERDRIWQITRQTAEGCNIPSAPPTEYLAPDEDGA